MDREPGDVVRQDLDLADVEPGADLEPELADLVADRDGAADRPGRAVERGKEAVADDLDLGPPNRSSWRRTIRLWSPSSRCQRASPSSAASRVDPTMSVNRTVASTRRGSGTGRTPVTKSWISATIAS